MLRTPNLWDPNNLAFADYGKAPDIIPIDCPLGDAERVVRQLNGSTGCSGVDAEHLKNQLLKHGKASIELCEELVEWALWLANTASPWASYQAMHRGRLVALDKQPGVRPLGIGEAWMRAISKLIFMQCGLDSKEACVNMKLCAGLEAGIEGAIHASIQRATKNNTMWFPDEGTHTAASKGRPSFAHRTTRPWNPNLHQHSQSTRGASPHPA